MRWLPIFVIVLVGPVLLGNAEEGAKARKVYPKKVASDKNFDGQVDHVEYFKDGVIERVESDTDFNGKMDDWTDYKDGRPVKTQKDSNGDGEPDTWVDY